MLAGFFAICILVITTIGLTGRLLRQQPGIWARLVSLATAFSMLPVLRAAQVCSQSFLRFDVDGRLRAQTPSLFRIDCI
jgi:hypothetical protein